VDDDRIDNYKELAEKDCKTGDYWYQQYISERNRRIEAEARIKELAKDKE